MTTKSAALLAAFLFTAAAPLPALAVQKPAATEQKGAAISKEAMPAIKALQDAANANNITQLPALSQAALAAAKTPTDRFFAYQLLFKPALAAKNDPMLLGAVEGAIGTNYLQGKELANLHLVAAKLRANANATDQAAAHIDQAAALDPNNAEIQAVVAAVRERQKRPADAIAALQKVAALDAAAGKPADPKIARQIYAIAVNNNLPQAGDLALAQLKTSPTPENWRIAIKLAEQRGNFQAADKVDLFRLQRATNSFQGEQDYYPYVDALITRGLPGEAKAVLSEAFAAGKLDKTKAPWKDLYSSAVTRDAADKSAPNGDVYLGRGDYAKAAAAYRAQVAKGGAGADTANLRLGIALARSGDKAGATAALNAVTGSKAGIAKMWLLYLGTQA
ncbi:hypothetical protein GCM10022281_22600 [Sphingomonas rosea]|uniref:Tetratricopeptide repeat protein n=1 Tax=Sphingomonas rosea TaxID=335605 RepID=A0ABP7UDQ6_9SPHN